MCSERRNCTRDAKTILKFCSFPFSCQSSSPSFQPILNCQHTAELGTGGHMLLFKRVNCTAWHEWSCSTHTVNHTSQVFGRILETCVCDCTLHCSCLKSQTWASATHRWFTSKFWDAWTQKTQDFVRVFLKQWQSNSALLHTVGL